MNRSNRWVRERSLRAQNTANNDRACMLAYAQNQFEITKCCVLYWHAMVTTGACKFRDTAVAGAQDSDEQKTHNALQTMIQHIHHLTELNDEINSLMSDE